MNGCQFSVRHKLSFGLEYSPFDLIFYNNTIVPVLFITPSFGVIRIDRTTVQLYQKRDSILDSEIGIDGHRLEIGVFTIYKNESQLEQLVSPDIVNTGIDSNVEPSNITAYTWNETQRLVVGGKKLSGSLGSLPNCKFYKYESRINNRFQLQSGIFAYGVGIENPIEYNSFIHSNHVFSAEACIEFSIL